MTTSTPGAAPPAGTEEYHLRRQVRLSGLTMISLGSIIGSGWLLGALTAAKAAGGASIISWIIGGLVIALLALVHAELGSTYPVSGGTARFPYMVFGSLGGFTGGWMAWVQAVTIAPIEVEATLGYLNAKFSGLNLVKANGTLDNKGIAIGAGFLLRVLCDQYDGCALAGRDQHHRGDLEGPHPAHHDFRAAVTVFHYRNFTAGGGFAPFGFHGIFAALPLGIVFALEGFEQAIQVGGEAENPQRNIPRAVILSMIIGTLHLPAAGCRIRRRAQPGETSCTAGRTPSRGVKAFGPYATLATAAGLGWLSTVLIIDAVVSPAGTGLVYIGTSSRLSYGLGRNGYFPKGIAKVSSRGVPLVSIRIAFVIGMLTFLPFPSWAGLVGLVTSATVLMYAMAPVSLSGLRSRIPIGAGVPSACRDGALPSSRSSART